MASVKYGVFVNSWAKHLRAWGKRTFWRRHRRETRIRGTDRNP